MEATMKSKVIQNTTSIAAVLGIAAWLVSPLRAEDELANQYRQTNLVSDQPGVAILQDPNLVNAWGMAFSSGSPIWVSDNGSGLATIYQVTYDANGLVHVSKLALQVRIPGAGNPTGQVFNDTSGFHGDIFLFDSEDGT